MRKLFPVVLIFLAACGSKTSNKNESKEYVMSMEGLDELKIGMKQAELEKLLNQKLVLINAETKAEAWTDTAHVNYKGIDVLLHLQREYPNDSSFYMILYALESNARQCRTDSGLLMGDSKEKILEAYPNNVISIAPDFEIVDDTTWVRSKTKSSIHVENEYSREIIFSLFNKKLSSLKVTMIFDRSD